MPAAPRRRRAAATRRMRPPARGWAGRGDTVYRLGAVGQDCRLGLWDIAVPGDDYLAGLPPLRRARSPL